jgi:hypothetical protein
MFTPFTGTQTPISHALDYWVWPLPWKLNEGHPGPDCVLSGTGMHNRILSMGAAKSVAYSGRTGTGTPGFDLKNRPRAPGWNYTATGAWKNPFNRLLASLVGFRSS